MDIYAASSSVFQECKAAGCRTRAEADAYLAEKAKRELESSARKARETGQVSAGSNKGPQRTNRSVNREKGELDGSPRSAVDSHRARGGGGLDVGGRELTPGSTGPLGVKSEDWDITGLPGADLLSESVRTPASVILASQSCSFLTHDSW